MKEDENRKEGRRVLLVEGKAGLARCVRTSLASGGYVVDAVATPAEARLRLGTGRYAALLVDTSLPDGKGFSLAADLRRAHGGLPIVFLVDEHVPDALVYVAEECEDEPGVVYDDLPVLPSRLDALLEDAPSRPSAVIRFGDLRLDRAHRVVTCAGKALSTTPTEYRVLEVLLAHGGSPVSSELIRQRVWSEKEAHSNILAVHIRNIRRKLAVLGHESVVRTVRGYGYALDNGSDDGSSRRDQDSFISPS